MCLKPMDKIVELFSELNELICHDGNDYLVSAAEY